MSNSVEISQILKQAKKGELAYCQECLWSPKKNGDDTSFGISCTKHGIDWKNDNKANSMFILQDPADTTPSKKGRLCAVCNSDNPSDKTAQQQLKLWNATVSMDYSNPQKNGYMKKHYWTNAIMHGLSSKNTSLRKKIEEVRNCCADVLAVQILSLQPNVVVASGKTAVNSLYKIGVLKNNWDILKDNFARGAYQETIINWRGMVEFTVFCTYHTSAGVVNRTLSKKYNTKIEQYIKEKFVKLNSPKSVDGFLAEYDDVENGNIRGMRYLLNHWLDIGEKIRKEYNKSF